MFAKRQREGSAQPKTSNAYTEALVAWTRGDHDTTLAILEAVPTSGQSGESLLLCARALIRKDRLHEARQWLARSVSSHRTANNHATQLMLQAAIQAREGNDLEAEALFTRALELKAHHTIHAEITYERALAQYSAQRYDDARATLRAIRPYSGIVYVRAIALEGWLDSAVGNYRSAQTAFGKALTALGECEAIDMFLRASLVYVFSMTVAELDQDHADRLMSEAARVSWNQSLVREQVQTLRHIGLVHRRAGRADDAMRLFGEAAGIEPGSPWEIIGLAECACLCVDRDEPVAARGYVTLAQRLVQQIEWATVLGEQRVALLVLAQALARLGEGVSARQLAEQFGLTPMRRLDAQYHDDRQWTYMQHTVGLVQAACGDIATARVSLSGAHRAWSRIGYRWRALEALSDIKRFDPRRIPDVVLDRASEVHRQLLAGEDRLPARAAAQMSGAALRERFTRQYNITSRMADILQRAVRGCSNEEIANELDLAERTVKNKMIQLYEIVGVRHRGATSRAELVARCMADIALITTASTSL